MRGVGGEAANARKLLDQHCLKHRIDLATLSDNDRQPRLLPIVVKAPGWKPKKDKRLVNLATQCLRYVCGTDAITFSDVYTVRYEAGTKTKTKTKRKRSAAVVFEVEARVTLAEWEDWRSCFDHYAPFFWEMQKKLIRQQRQLAAAIKKSVSVFINHHDLFPPDAGESNATPTPEEIATYRAASRAVFGETWQRPAGRLEEPNFMLQ